MTTTQRGSQIEAIPHADARSRNRAGTTFVEAVIALALFAIFTVGASKLLVSHRKTLDMARDRYIAANIAKNRIELVRTFDFDQIPEMAETGIRTNDGGIPSSEGNFQRTTQVSMLNANLYGVTCTVKIKNRKTLAFGPAAEELNTYVAKHL